MPYRSQITRIFRLDFLVVLSVLAVAVWLLNTTGGYFSSAVVLRLAKTLYDGIKESLRGLRAIAVARTASSSKNENPEGAPGNSLE